jgi:hypothetical protein
MVEQCRTRYPLFYLWLLLRIKPVSQVVYDAVYLKTRWRMPYGEGVLLLYWK